LRTLLWTASNIIYQGGAGGW